MIIKIFKLSNVLACFVFILGAGNAILPGDCKHNKVKLKGSYINPKSTPNSLNTINDSGLKDILAKPIEDKPFIPLNKIAANDVSFKIKSDDILIQNYRGFIIEVKNNTDRPIIFEADKAYLDNTKKKQLCFSIDKLFNVNTSRLYEFKTGAKAAIPAALTVGLYPTIKDIKEDKGPFLDRFGADEKRRQEQLSSFRKRILWPNDTSCGRVYFDNDYDFNSAKLTMPIVSFFDAKDTATISTVLNVK